MADRVIQKAQQGEGFCPDPAVVVPACCVLLSEDQMSFPRHSMSLLPATKQRVMCKAA